MSKIYKILQKILSGSSDKNIKFSELRRLLLYTNFEERIKGSHHIFRKSDIDMMINIQKDGNKAKPYQVKQIRDIILKNNLINDILDK